MDTFQMIGLFLLLLTTVTARIQLVSNGYEGVVVSISADIDENPDLLTKLESILTDGSASLFKATKNQMYFREIIVVVPENWPRQDHYEDALDLELDQADIKIDLPNDRYGFTPYVKQCLGCGLGGIYMHLTPTYILNDTVRGWYGRPGVFITHEWGHLRYGVFDEYSYSREERFYRFGNTWYPTMCTEEITGVLENVETGEQCQIDPTQGPEENCRFRPHRDTPAVASIMFGNDLNNIEQFCDSADTAPKHLKHNAFANNRQNNLCSYQSAWEVMRSHPDFIGLSNQAALPNNTDTQPRFRYVQAHPRKRVLVLDTSGSMKGDPLAGLIRAASIIILENAENGSQVGIVRFASSASILSPLVEISSDDNRTTLLQALPSNANGSTGIGGGLLLGLQVLNETRSLSGGSLILVSDGHENRMPYIDAVVPDILKAGVVVHTLSYGQSADPKLEYLSNITGGLAGFYTGSQYSSGHLDSFAKMFTRGNSLKSTKTISIPLLTEANIVTRGNPLNGSFLIDSTIGKDTTLTFSFTGSIKVDIESPDGPYNATSVTEYAGRDTSVHRFSLENDLPPALWSYSVTTTDVSVPVLISIQSKPKGQAFIQTNSWLSQNTNITFSNSSSLGVYVEVLRGRTPVLDALVIATVETPTGTTFDRVLSDNGLGIDIIKADGVYSANIIATDFTGDGHYNIKIKVIGTKERTKVFVARTDGGRRPPIFGFDELNTKIVPLEDFQRVTSAGVFRIIGYTPLVGDQLPPGRIVDLNAKTYNSSTHAVTLEWTAVGGDLDRDQAAKYIIYKSLDMKDIISNLTSASHVPEHHVLVGNLSSPSAAGHREKFVVFLQELEYNDTETVYMSISAVDGAGNEGEPSNMAIVSDAREAAFMKNNSDSKFHPMGLAVVIPVAFAVVAAIALRFLW